MLAVVAVTAALAMSGCGDQTEESNAESSSASTSFNDADVSFATAMIPHHAQALDMVAMAQEHELSPEVTALVDQVQAAQEPEIETMTGWLEGWDETVPDASAMSAKEMEDMNETGDAEGMMSAMSMRQLRNAPDTAFEDVWLSMMINHHQGAIAMAEAQTSAGENPDAVALAEDIVASQSGEIETMKELIGRG